MNENRENSPGNIVWAVEGIVKQGQREALDIVMNDMVEVTRKEAGAMIYEWTLGEDGKTLHVYERYENEEAALAHLATWGQNAHRFMSVVDITRIVVYSALTHRLKAAFGGPDTAFMTPVGGFSR